MTLLDVPRATSSDLTEVLQVLASSQQDVVQALSRLAGPVTAEVQQLAALILVLQRRLEAFEVADDDHPGLRVPPLDDGAAAPVSDDDRADALRAAEVALRDAHRRVVLHDPQHPTITELIRLQTELIGASLVPLVHVLAELSSDVGQLERAIAARGASRAATIS